MTIRVLIADDSRAMRQALATLLQADPRLQVVGRAADGVEAVSLAKTLKPDVITMDVRMPGLDGLEATAAIMATVPARILMVCSVGEREQQQLSFRAMEVGALEVIAKPGDGDSLEGWGVHVADSIALMAEVPVVTRRLPSSMGLRERAPGAPGFSLPAARRIRAVGIAASTGGPPALAQILADLPRDLPFPILVAQHIAPGFADGLVSWLALVSPLAVRIAANGPAEPGQVYFPPDGHDLLVDASGNLKVQPSSGGICPSANRLLRSLAQAFGADTAGIVLTGMGDDGADGLAAIRTAGGPTFAQDARTSVVYGMPQAAVLRGAVRVVLPLNSLAGAIRGLILSPQTETLVRPR
jgi:two-component system chemotaxis response regulator CheB